LKTERTPLLLSFSGIDGAGKSTQIEALSSWLVSAGLKVSILSMWDDAVACRRLRELASRCAFRGDQGVGTPERPLSRRDKNIQSRLLNVFRYFFYFTDAVSLWFRFRSLIDTSNYDVLIFDRYIYDELANLQLKQRHAKEFARLVLKIAPAPDIAYIIDADPEIASLRKPEYPLEFLRVNRESFFALRTLVHSMIVIDNSSLSEASNKIRQAFLSKLPVPRLNSLLPAMRP
jgi:thymidylate kinase